MLLEELDVKKFVKTMREEGRELINKRNNMLLEQDRGFETRCQRLQVSVTTD